MSAASTASTAPTEAKYHGYVDLGFQANCLSAPSQMSEISSVNSLANALVHTDANQQMVPSDASFPVSALSIKQVTYGAAAQNRCTFKYVLQEQRGQPLGLDFKNQKTHKSGWFAYVWYVCANSLFLVPCYVVLVHDGLDALCCKNNSLPMAAKSALPFPHQLAS